MHEMKAKKRMKMKVISVHLIYLVLSDKNKPLNQSHGDLPQMRKSGMPRGKGHQAPKNKCLYIILVPSYEMRDGKEVVFGGSLQMIPQKGEIPPSNS